MSSKNVGQALHDRATRGETLSAAERVQLEAWYAEQDQAESLLLGAPIVPSSLEVLQGQLRAALAQLLIVSQKIQELSTQNDQLRQEIVGLKVQLAQRMMIQSA